MASRLITLVPYVQFQLEGATGSTQTMNFGVRAVSTRDWKSGVLLVTVWSKTINSSTATLDILVQNTMIIPDNPSGQPIEDRNVASRSITSATASGVLLATEFTAPIGPMVMPYMKLTQGANSGSTTVTLTVQLLGRDT